MVQIEWEVKGESVKLVKDNGSEMILRVGEYFTHDLREQGMRIEKFEGGEGPIGMAYLPWRGTRWATPSYSLKGNNRIIICYPHGNQTYGQHINWNSVKHLSELTVTL